MAMWTVTPVDGGEEDHPGCHYLLSVNLSNIGFRLESASKNELLRKG